MDSRSRKAYRQKLGALSSANYSCRPLRFLLCLTVGVIVVAGVVLVAYHHDLTNRTITFAFPLLLPAAFFVGILWPVIEEIWDGLKVVRSGIERLLDTVTASFGKDEGGMTTAGPVQRRRRPAPPRSAHIEKPGKEVSGRLGKDAGDSVTTAGPVRQQEKPEPPSPAPAEKPGKGVSGTCGRDATAFGDFCKSASALIRHGRVSVRARDRFGNTALHYAAEKRLHKLVRMLVEAGSDIEAKNNRGMTPLMLAAGNGDWATAAILRFLGAACDMRAAIDTGNERIAREFARLDACLDGRDPKGRSPLALAVLTGMNDVVRLLCGKCDLNERDDEYLTPLMLAITSGNLVAADILLDAGASVHRSGFKGRTPFTLAWVRGHYQLAERLLSLGAKVNIADIAANGAIRHVEKLLAMGVDPCARGVDGHSAIVEAALRGDVKTLINIAYAVQDTCPERSAPRIILANGRLHSSLSPTVVDHFGFKLWFRQGKLHRNGGPAYEPPDGPCEYYLNGVKVPPHIACLDASEIDPREIYNFTDVDVRREIVRKIGVKRIVDKLFTEVELIDDNEDLTYELINVPLGIDVFGVYLGMKNPSTGEWHYEGVPYGTPTVRDALMWRNKTHEKPIVLT